MADDTRVTLSYWDREWIKGRIAGQAFAACLLGALIAVLLVAAVLWHPWHDEQHRIDRLAHRVHVLEIETRHG